MAGTKGKSGGSRSGSGRPRKKKAISEKVKNNYLKAARELAKEYGEPIEKAVLRLIYKDKVQDSVKASVLKVYNEALLIRESEKDINTNRNRGPSIFKINDRGEMVVVELGSSSVCLPEMKPDPAKLIPIEGGKK